MCLQNLYVNWFLHKTKRKLGGQRETLTVYFSDIQDFASISERLSAEDLVDHLEGLFDRNE